MATDDTSPPRLGLGALFRRFLGFGALAFGGPVAQIGMLQRELVEEERWISMEQWKRVLAVYQVLPGPEAHELCVYFGYRARGRWGGLVAGLGFMLPGLVLMLVMSALYLELAPFPPAVAAAFAGMQAAVVALIARAAHRIAGHALGDAMSWVIALASCGATLAGAHFGISLLGGGLVYTLHRTGRRNLAILAGALWGGAVAWTILHQGVGGAAVAGIGGDGDLAQVGPGTLFVSGLKAGLLTFGGAYTAIPFLQEDAVHVGRWVTQQQFLDGLALSGILPAPLIIFATFVGYVGGGLAGALAITAGIFLPAFGFTLIAHEPLEKLTKNPAIRDFLEGVTAAVVGLIGTALFTMAPAAITSLGSAAIAAAALAALYVVGSRLVVLYVMAGSAAAGVLVLSGS